jgi:hypothetical protein
MFRACTVKEQRTIGSDPAAEAPNNDHPRGPGPNAAAVNCSLRALGRSVFPWIVAKCVGLPLRARIDVSVKKSMSGRRVMFCE